MTVRQMLKLVMLTLAEASDCGLQRKLKRKMTTEWNMSKNCAFSGHRHSVKELDLNLLDRVILNLIKNGARNFYCGMAVGFDLAAAESVLNYKKDYNVKLFACIPCEGQSDGYSQINKRRYDDILRRCDGEIVLSDEYHRGCMLARDRFLVENCGVLVSFLRKEKGGTYYTVNYARQKNIKIIEL